MRQYGDGPEGEAEGAHPHEPADHGLFFGRVPGASAAGTCRVEGGSIGDRYEHGLAQEVQRDRCHRGHPPRGGRRIGGTEAMKHKRVSLLLVHRALSIRQ